MMKNKIKFILAVLIVFVLLYYLKIGCPIKFFTGISCMGCGMTRALYAVLRLDFNMAFYYHPLFVLTFFIPVYFIFQDKLEKRVRKFLGWTFILLFIIVYFIRLIDGDNEIVNIDIRNGFIAKVVKSIYYFIDIH